MRRKYRREEPVRIRPLRVPSMLALLATVTVSGCSKPGSVSLAEGPRHYDASDYRPTLKKWTRKAELVSVDEMDNVLSVTSTYESWDFRWAYAERYAIDYRLSDEKKRALLKRNLDESQKYHQFYVALFAQYPAWGELDVDEPAWVVRLVDSAGTETDPIKLDRIRRPTPRELSYFPYTNSFRTVYRVSFPRTTDEGTQSIAPEADWFALRFAGAQGQTDVIWEIE